MEIYGTPGTPVGAFDEVLFDAADAEGVDVVSDDGTGGYLFSLPSILLQYWDKPKLQHE